MVQKA